MSDHIPDAGKMVPDAWVDAALDAYSDNEWRTSASAMRAALAAVAPFIAKAERERCARVADAERHNTAMLTSLPPQSAAALKIAAAIRALGDAT